MSLKAWFASLSYYNGRGLRPGPVARMPAHALFCATFMEAVLTVAHATLTSEFV
jgi:hypothetical protein